MQHDFVFYKEKADEEADFGCLDHFYFSTEFRKLKRLADETRRERFEKRLSKGTDYELAVFNYIFGLIEDLDWSNQQMEQFDPNQLLGQMTDFAETLLKIKAGKLPEGEFDLAMLQEYQDCEEYPEDDYYDEQAEAYEMQFEQKERRAGKPHRVK